MSLTGRVAIVSGGAGKLGAAFAVALGELGAAVAIIDQDNPGCLRVAEDVHSRYCVQVLPLQVDLKDVPAVRAIPEQVAVELGGVDILVNCAALVGTSNLKGWAVPFEQQSVESWRLAMDVNLTAPFVLVQAAVPWLRASGHGSIINIGSIYGIVGPDWRLYDGTSLGNPAAYAASKGGILQLTRWLATTLAPEIRVNAVSPGGVFRGHSEPFLSRYIARTPMGRMATEEDVIGAVAYLASDLSAYVTGQNLTVDGAWTIW